MRELQILKGSYEHGEVLAHTDFNELTDNEIEKQSGAKNKPPHAGAGAYAALEILGNYFNDKRKIKNILFPIVTAIIKHHSPETALLKVLKLKRQNLSPLCRYGARKSIFQYKFNHVFFK
jgi:hypothetical protein